MRLKNKRRRVLRFGMYLALGVIGACLFGAAALIVYQLPPVHERLAPRVASVQSRVQRALNPPEQVVFVPQGPGRPGAAETVVKATLDALTVSTPTDGALQTPEPTAAGSPDLASATLLPATETPLPETATPTPLPAVFALSGVVHEYQQFNNCGPANLAMALSYWGWQGDQRDTRSFLRPNTAVDDKNVMVSEMVAYVEQFTDLKALTRVGGDIDLLRRLISADYPVLIEAGHHPADDWWMGHYLVVTAYNDGLQQFTVQDSLILPDLPMSYAELGDGWWRDFNYVYVVIYPPEQEAEVAALLGERLDVAASYRLAERKALEEITRLEGRDLFFAWFNLGTSRVGLEDWTGAADAYDQAFKLYERLPEDLRPYRLMWYQDGPYAAYYHTERYQDVVNLANTTFTWVGKPVLEESYYWRGRAYAALGLRDQAVSDLQRAVELNPYYAPPRDELATLGIAVP